jgi:Ca2+-binding EF-hand superfamily protein
MRCLAPVVLLGVVAGSQDEKLGWCDSDVSTAEFIRGNYENKIRFFSQPEKIFETFASVQKEDGTLAMTYTDFLYALTPYNYSHLRSKEELKDYLENHHDRVARLLRYADSDGDGEISFTEFFFFVTVLQVPESTVHRQFDKNKDGLLSPEEFSNLFRRKDKGVE